MGSKVKTFVYLNWGHGINVVKLGWVYQVLFTPAVTLCKISSEHYFSIPLYHSANCNASRLDLSTVITFFMNRLGLSLRKFTSLHDQYFSEPTRQTILLWDTDLFEFVWRIYHFRHRFPVHVRAFFAHNFSAILSFD
jgi:hypothetical protein